MDRRRFDGDCRRAAAPRWFWLLTNVATNGDRARARRGARCTRWRRATARSRRRSGARRRRTPGSRSWGAGSPAPACCTWAGRGAATPGWSTPTATSAASSCPRAGATGATSQEQSEQRSAFFPATVAVAVDVDAITVTELAFSVNPLC